MTVWIPLLAWAAVIFALSSIPNLKTAGGHLGDALSTGAHAVEYAVFGALLLRALGGRLAALAGGLAYAVSDELHQSFVPGRQTSAYDLLVDAVGLLAGMLLLGRLRR